MDLIDDALSFMEPHRERLPSVVIVRAARAAATDEDARAFAHRARVATLDMTQLDIATLRQPHAIGLVVDLDEVGDSAPRVVEWSKRMLPGLPLVLITEQIRVDIAVWALRSGVRDVIERPLERAQVDRIADDFERVDALRRLQGGRNHVTRPLPDCLLAAPPARDRNARILVAATNYIERHLADDLHLARVAAACSCAPARLAAVIRDAYGCVFRLYVVRRRIARAQQLLLQSDVAIGEIGYLCGFQDNAYFSRTFKRLIRLTPGQFRGTESRRCEVEAGPAT